MHWTAELHRLRRERVGCVLVTVVTVRGHAPRAPGAKMIVTAEASYGTVGGGNLEETALRRARAMLRDGTSEPEQLPMSLSEHAAGEYGVQCCGGEVTLLLDPQLPVPAVAIFGMGHVGRELAHILARHDIDLYLADSRPAQIDSLAEEMGDTVAELAIRRVPVPELLLGEVPAGTHVVIMSHDHAEDAALCDAALRCSHLGTIGLIGSRAKWRRFEKTLGAEGHSPEEIARIQCPVGLPQIASKEPAAIAVGVAAVLLAAFARDRQVERST